MTKIINESSLMPLIWLENDRNKIHAGEFEVLRKD